MVVSKVLSILLVLSIITIHVAANATTVLESKLVGDVGVKAIDCGGACAVRCSQSSRPNLCKRACGTCCFRCKCVPSGTSGNYEECPCYASLTTRGNRRKCP